MKKSMLVFLVATLALLAGLGTALAFSSYLTPWRTIYPSSLADENVINGTTRSCQLCHQLAAGGDGWNGYGWAMRQQLGMGLALADAIRAIEALSSDGDPTAATNLTEINASTQPGWTPGPSNTIFFADATTLAGQSPPAAILGSLDPAPAAVPAINVAPLVLDFGAVTVGMTGARTTTVSNVGTADLTVTGLTFAGSPDFALNPSPLLPLTLAAGGHVTLSVDYLPSSPGADSGSLAVASNDPAMPSVSVALTGTGVPPAPVCALAVSPLALAFGSVPVGTTTALSTAISNTGTGPCVVSSLTRTGSPDFALGAAAPIPPFSIAPGGNVPVPVSYTPAAAGGASGTLDVASDDPRNPLISVTLTGSGVAAGAVDLDIKSFRVTEKVTLGKHESVRLRLEVKNRGKVDEPRPATVVGTQGGVEVFRQTRPVSARAGKEARFDFGPYTPTAPGDILWAATIADDDPDRDMATARTRVERKDDDHRGER